MAARALRKMIWLMPHNMRFYRLLRARRYCLHRPGSSLLFDRRRYAAIFRWLYAADVPMLCLTLIIFVTLMRFEMILRC